MKRSAKEMREIQEYCWEQYASQIPAIGKRGQDRLRRARVHVAGLGGLGMSIAINLAAIGVGAITANDPQALEPDNINRIPIASLHDVAISKVQLLARFLQFRPGLHFQGLTVPSESKEATALAQQNDCIVCCSNTIRSRMAVTRTALRSNRFLVDVSVADARQQSAGFIKICDPQARGLACPACYYNPHQKETRGEALLPTVVWSTAAMATHAVFLWIVGRTQPGWNFAIIDLGKSLVETMTVFRNRSCPVCSKNCT
jgi:molybdopterin/thiamine biosynthesis adenylyltransferase